MVELNCFLGDIYDMYLEISITVIRIQPSSCMAKLGVYIAWLICVCVYGTYIDVLNIIQSPGCRSINHTIFLPGYIYLLLYLC